MSDNEMYIIHAVAFAFHVHGILREVCSDDEMRFIELRGKGLGFKRIGQLLKTEYPTQSRKYTPSWCRACEERCHRVLHRMLCPPPTPEYATFITSRHCVDTPETTDLT